METMNHFSGSLQVPVCQRCWCIEIAAETTEVALADLSQGDLLLIQTANSTYSFCVTDEAEKCRLLMGGRARKSGSTALLLGAMGEEGDNADVVAGRLAVGLSAVFVISVTGELGRLVTSTIQNLTHIQVAVGQS